MRRFLLIGIFLACCGCATLYNPATGRNEMIFINSDTETAIGKNVIAELSKTETLSGNERLRQRVNSVGSRIVAVSDRHDVQYQFDVLANKELNAMALPGGFIYVNEGLAAVLTDDELAYVISHEVGHVAARHIAKKLQAGIVYQTLLSIAFAGSGAGTNAQALAQGATIIYSLISLGYSRQDEYEADRLGAKYAYAAGFDPYASIQALEKLKKNEGPNWKALAYFRSHPYVDERIAALKKEIPRITKE